MQQNNTMQLLKIQKSHHTNANTLDCKKSAHQYNRNTWVQDVVKRNRFLFKEVRNKIGAQKYPAEEIG